MATLAVKDVTLLDTDPELAAADNAGDEFPNEQRTLFVVHNGGESEVTVTIASQAAARPGIAADDLEVAVPAGEVRVIPIEGASVFEDADGMVQVTYSAVTDVSVGAIR